MKRRPTWIVPAFRQPAGKLHAIVKGYVDVVAATVLVLIVPVYAYGIVTFRRGGSTWPPSGSVALFAVINISSEYEKTQHFSFSAASAPPNIHSSRTNRRKDVQWAIISRADTGNRDMAAAMGVVIGAVVMEADMVAMEADMMATTEDITSRAGLAAFWVAVVTAGIVAATIGVSAFLI
ncbi:hypothetical protein [Rhizobium metallidurans]|uniref:Transmembrane protein n=1 Tax=Rhizobium metallidurans TaxID=1265931 RepID=A0A7W6GF10_9HYPH|nr:hypothetical protein [Rhizobium metallidurans]MBB3967241.1 hypothetical protein [Rhizobium metallidurans]